MTIRTFLDFLWFQVCVSQSFSAFLGPAALCRFGGNYYISTLQEAGVTPRRARTRTGLYNLHLCLKNQMSQ